MITRRLIPTTLLRLSALALLILGLGLTAASSRAAGPPPPAVPAAAPAPAGANGTAAPADTQDFEDVPVSAPYYLYLHALYTQGIVTGYPCGGPGELCGPGNLPYYRPANSVIRSQMSKFVVLARTLPGAAFEGGTTGILPLSAHTNSGNAFVGISNNGNGVYAFSNTGGAALWGQSTDSYGVYAASSTNDALHVVGKAHIVGDTTTTGKFYTGGLIIANEFGTSADEGLLVVGSAYIDGNFHATGTCCGATSLTTQIDDPRDATHQTLNQAAVTGSEQLSVYSGNVTTDPAGLATVRLPGYVQAVNGDFRYQLTVVGQFAQAIVAQEISDNHFTIQTDKPGVKVSWQVTGVRTDPAALQHPLVVEQPRSASRK